MSNPDTACHGSPGIFTKVAIEAFCFKVGRETKLLFEELKHKSSIEKETWNMQDWERRLLCIHKDKRFASAFTQFFHISTALAWREREKKWPREKKKKPFRYKNFIRKVNSKRIPCSVTHTVVREISWRLRNKEKNILSLKYRRGQKIETVLRNSLCLWLQIWESDKGGLSRVMAFWRFLLTTS